MIMKKLSNHAVARTDESCNGWIWALRYNEVLHPSPSKSLPFWYTGSHIISIKHTAGNKVSSHDLSSDNLLSLYISNRHTLSIKIQCGKSIHQYLLALFLQALHQSDNHFYWISWSSATTFQLSQPHSYHFLLLIQHTAGNPFTHLLALLDFLTETTEYLHTFLQLKLLNFLTEVQSQLLGQLLGLLQTGL